MYNKNTLIQTYNKYAHKRNNAEINEKKLKEIDLFIKYLKDENKESILDIGCGTGEITLYFQNNNFKVTGIDFSENMLKYAKEKKLNVTLLDCYNIDSLNQYYDGLFSMNCLLHIPSKDFPGILGKIKNILSNDGLFYLGLWSGDNFEGICEKDEYEPKRYFVFYNQKTLLNDLMEHFKLLYYNHFIIYEKIFFHSCILRNG